MNKTLIFRLEWSIAFLMLVVAAIPVGGQLVEMATTSLWHDELTSIEAFSSKGVKHSLTSYTSSNNHMLFNAIQSLVPGIERGLPGRSRAFSIGSTVLAFLCVVGYFAWRRKPMVGVLAVLPFLMNHGFIDRIGQARSYGPLAFLGVLSAIGIIEYSRQRKTGFLILVGVTVSLSTWMLYPVMLFWGVAMVLLWLAFRTAREFIAGAMTATISGIFLLPIMSQAAHTVGGLDFGDYYVLHAPFVTIADLVLGNQKHVAWGAIIGGVLLGVPIVAWAKSRKQFIGESILAVTMLIFFGICLYLQHVAHRSMSFTMLPIAIAFWSVVADFQVSEIWNKRLIIGSIFFLLLVSWNRWEDWRRFRYIVPEDYLGVTQWVERYFPAEGFPAVSNGRHNWGGFYATDGRLYEREVDERLVGLGSGKLILDNRRSLPEKGRKAPDAYGEGAVAVDFPQRAADRQRVIFVPPKQHGVIEVEAGKKPGTTSGRTFLVTGRALGGERLVVFLETLNVRKPLRLKWRSSSGEKWKTLEMDPLDLIRDKRMAAWTLPGTKGGEFELVLATSVPAETMEELSIWCW